MTWSDLVTIIGAAFAPFVPAEIDALGSDVWRDRERATVALIAADRRGADLAEFWASWHADAEVRSRCRYVVDHYYRIDGPLPWIANPREDPHPYATSAMIRKWLGRALLVHDADNADYGHWRTASLLWARQQLRDGVPRDEVNRSLDVMRTRESEWKKRMIPNNGGNDGP